MRRFRSLARRLFPSPWLIWVGVLLYVPYESFYLWIRWQLGIELPELWKTRDIIMAAYLVVFGVARVFGRHPLFSPDYREWLAQTPWTIRKPLPRGAVRLALQDAVVLAVVYFILHDIQINPLWLPLVFLFSYLSMLCVSFWVTRVWPAAFVLTFGLGLAVRAFEAGPAASLIVVLSLYGVAWVGLWQSLRRFPWPEVQWKWLATSHQRLQPNKPLGWLFGVLTPNDPGELMSRRMAVMVSLLGGWWVYAVLSHVKSHELDEPVVPIVFALPLFGVAFWRLTKYIGHTLPPLTLYGRIRLKQWIIPGYDQALVAPLLAVLTCIAAPSLMDKFGAPPATFIAVTVGLVLLILLAGGPSLRKFKLTGDYRMVPGAMDRRKFAGH